MNKWFAEQIKGVNPNSWRNYREQMSQLPSSIADIYTDIKKILIKNNSYSFSKSSKEFSVIVLLG